MAHDRVKKPLSLRRKPAGLVPMASPARNQQDDQAAHEPSPPITLLSAPLSPALRNATPGATIAAVVLSPRDAIFVDFHCTRFRRHVDLSGWTLLSDSALQLLRNGTFESLSLDDCEKATTSGLSSISNISSAAKTLTCISLERCRGLSAESIACFPVALLEVNLSYCEWVDDQCIRALAKRCKLLTKVSLRHCKRLTDYGVAAFPDASPKPALTFLDISLCTKVTDVGLLALFTKAFKLQELLASGLPMLEGVNLQGLSRTTGNSLQSLDLSSNARMHSMAIAHLVRVYANAKLVDLNLSSCTQVTDETLVALGRFCPNLLTLRLASCPLVSDAGVQRLVEFVPPVASEDDTAGFMENESATLRCVKLQTLELTGCFQLTDAAFLALGHKCADLRVLLIDGVRRLSALGLRAIAERCKQLRTLCWGGILVRSSKTSANGVCAGFFSIPHLDRAALSALSHASALEKLHIGNTKCDTEALCLLLARLGPRNMTDLDVTSIATDAICHAIGASCVHLRTLRLSRSRYFSETSFLSVARGCRELRVLDLESCEQIRDQSIAVLSECCAHLEKLVLANDWQVTDKSIELLAIDSRCMRLLTLNVRHCPEVTLHALQRLAGRLNHCVEVSSDGLVPKHSNVIRFLRKHSNRKTAACKITRWLKQQLNDRYYSKNALEQALKCSKRRKRCAVRIQRFFRHFNKQRKQKRMVEQVRHERDERVQRAWMCVRDYCLACRQLRVFIRQWLATRRLRLLREAERVRIVRDQAAVAIQKIVRGFLGRRKALAARRAALLRHQKRVASAATIQRVVRGHWSRKKTIPIRNGREILVFSAILIQSQRECAMLHVQRLVRGFLGRRRSKQRAVYLEELRVLRNKSASCIQRRYRSYLARVQLSRFLFRAANQVQRVYRGHCGRKGGRAIVLERSYAAEPRILILMRNSIFSRAFAVQWKRKRDAAVVLAFNVQTLYRGYIGRLLFRVALAMKRQMWYTTDVSARAIQHFFRSIMILKRLARFQAHLRLRRRSATKIQATWRMWTAKVLAFSLMLRADRRRKHEALLRLLAFADRDARFKFHFLQLGAVSTIIRAYRASLQERGWQSPSHIRFLNRCATKIQALMRGHFGRLYAKWYRETLVAAACVMQRVWRGKVGRKIWRQLVTERKQRLRDQEEEDRAARVSRKLSSQYGLDAYEKDSKHARLLQGWYRTMRNRQLFKQAAELRAKALELRATEKLALVMKMSTESVVFQSRVWRDCMEQKEALREMEEDACVAMEQEIAELKKACRTAHVATSQAASEHSILLQRKSGFVRAKKQLARATEQVKTRIKPFAVQAKKLTKQSARVHVVNKQLQHELRSVHKSVAALHRHLHEVLPYELLLLQSDVAYLLSLLELPNGRPSLVADEVGARPGGAVLAEGATESSGGVDFERIH